MTANMRNTKMIERDADAQIMDAISLAPEDVALITGPTFDEWVDSVEAAEHWLLCDAEDALEAENDDDGVLAERAAEAAAEVFYSFGPRFFDVGAQS